MPTRARPSCRCRSLVFIRSLDHFGRGVSACGRLRATRLGRVSALVAVVLWVAGCAAPLPLVEVGRAQAGLASNAAASPPVVVHTTLNVAGTSGTQALPVEWHAPTTAPTVMVALQHGFTRQCAHLRSLAQALATHGMMTLCVQRTSLTTGDDWVVPLARWMVDPRSQDPWGRALPSHVVTAGHSAGALLALRLGVAWIEAQAANGAPPDSRQPRSTRQLAGAVLLDPVASRQWRSDLWAVSAQGTRPVRAIMASTSPCNARLSAWPGLQALRRDLLDRGLPVESAQVGIQLTVRSTHMDAEGPSSDALARWACGGHDPTAENFQALTQVMLQWIDEMVSAKSAALAKPAIAVPWRPIE